MTTFPKSRCERAISDAQRRARRGEISADTAHDLAARAEQADRIRRAVLDAAQGGA